MTSAIDDRVLLGRVLARHGGDRSSGQHNNVSLKSKYGNSVSYIVARLRRDGHAEVAVKVIQGELSAYRAAVLAGYCKEPASLDHVLRLISRLSSADRAALLDRLAVERAIDFGLSESRD
jgi:hypothetical protein